MSPHLSVRLREETRAAHADVEVALDARDAFASRAAYGELLQAMRGFLAPVEALLAVAPGWEQLSPPVDVRAFRRVPGLDADLAHLGTAGVHPPASPVPRLGGVAQRLGCLYVLEGSALGGPVLAARARAALGADLPLAYFDGVRPGPPGAAWRALCSALDAFGDDDHLAGRAVAAALATFAALAGCLTAVRVPA